MKLIFSDLDGTLLTTNKQILSENILTAMKKCRQMYDHVLFSYIAVYLCLAFLLPTSTSVFRYSNLGVIALTDSFGFFSDVASPAFYLTRLDLTLDVLLGESGWPSHFRRGQPFYCN